MRKLISTAGLVAALVIGGAAAASAQGGSTGPDGRAVASEHVGNGAMKGGAMHNGGTSGITIGMSNSRAGQDTPNGNPNRPPTAKQGPVGDPSRDSDAPK